MVWQDIIISISQILFSIALLPQIYLGFKNRKCSITLMTSVPTFIGLYAISFCFYTLSLYFSAIISLVAGTLWFILFLQRIIY